MATSIAGRNSPACEQPDWGFRAYPNNKYRFLGLRTFPADLYGQNEFFRDISTSHIVIIIGYNEDTNEIAFSDSWGEQYKERWISIPEAEQISQQRFYVIDL